MNRIIVLCLISILFFACDKEKLKPLEEGNPVFYISGKMDNQDWSIIGGYDKYFLFNDYERDGDLIKFNSTFQQSDCQNNCPKTFTINFWDNEYTTDGSSVDIYQTITPGEYEFSDEKNLDNRSKANIIWNDGLNKTYSTRAAAQPDSAFFKVVSIGHYDNNVKNQPTVKVEVKISCILYNVADTTDAINFSRSFGVFAVAYP